MKKNLRKKILAALMFVPAMFGSFANAIDIPLDNVEVVEATEISGDSKSAKSLNNLDKEVNATVLPAEINTKEEKNVMTVGEVVEDSSLGDSKGVVPLEDIVPGVKGGDKPLERLQIEKMKLKIYKNVKYIKGYDWFSLTKPNKEAYKKYLDSVGISMIEANSLIGFANTDKAIFVSALYYDLIKKKPELAENFHLKFEGPIRKFRFIAKEALADYLVRTGRGAKVVDFLSRGDCYSLKREYAAECFYYRGLGELFKTGKKDNSSLKKASKYIQKARIIIGKRR